MDLCSRSSFMETELRAVSLLSPGSSLLMVFAQFLLSLSLFTVGFWELEHSKYQGMDPMRRTSVVWIQNIPKGPVRWFSR